MALRGRLPIPLARIGHGRRAFRSLEQARQHVLRLGVTGKRGLVIQFPGFIRVRCNTFAASIQTGQPKLRLGATLLRQRLQATHRLRVVAQAHQLVNLVECRLVAAHGNDR